MVSIRNQGKSDLTILLREILMDNLGLTSSGQHKHAVSAAW